MDLIAPGEICEICGCFAEPLVVEQGGTEDESVMTSLKFEIDREVGYRRLSSSLRCVRGDDGMMDGRE